MANKTGIYTNSRLFNKFLYVDKFLTYHYSHHAGKALRHLQDSARYSDKGKLDDEQNVYGLLFDFVTFECIH